MGLFDFITNLFKKQSSEIHGEVNDITNVVVDKINADIQKHINEIIEISTIKEVLVEKLSLDGIKINADDIQIIIEYKPSK